MHRTKVRVVEEALDTNNTTPSANRSDFDRADVTVVGLMSAPGAARTTMLERALAGLASEDPPALRVDVLEGDVPGSSGEGAEQLRAWPRRLPARVAAEAAHDHEHLDHAHLEHATA